MSRSFFQDLQLIAEELLGGSIGSCLLAFQVFDNRLKGRAVSDSDVLKRVDDPVFNNEATAYDTLKVQIVQPLQIVGKRIALDAMHNQFYIAED